MLNNVGTQNTLFEDIIAFHTKFGLVSDMKPKELDNETALFRIGFMVEEIAEYAQAAGYTSIARSLNTLHESIKDNNRWVVNRNESGRDLEMQFDSLIDLVYVALGTCYLQGIDFDEGWRRVHAANMRKVRAKTADESKRGTTLDVVKPVGWKPADLSDLVK